MKFEDKRVDGVSTMEVWAVNAEGKEYDEPAGYLNKREVCEYIKRAEEL